MERASSMPPKSHLFRESEGRDSRRATLWCHSLKPDGNNLRGTHDVNGRPATARRGCDGRGAWTMQTDEIPIDPEVLRQLRLRATPTEPHFFEDIVSLFLADLEKQLASIDEGLRTQDSEKLAKAAHAIGGGG